MSADGRLIIREEEDANAKMEEEEGAKGGCPRGRGQGCMHLLMRPFTHLVIQSVTIFGEA